MSRCCWAKGDGSFQQPPLFAVGDRPQSWLVVGDLNNDGQLDAVTANYRSGDVSILLGQGDGSRCLNSGSRWVRTLLPWPWADFSNGDGRLDLAVTNNNPSDSGTVSIYLGRGDGTFLDPTLYDVGLSPTAIVVGRFRRPWRPRPGDHRGMAAPATSPLLLGNGNGSFQPEIRYRVGDSPTSIAMADFNKDGHPDLAVVNSGSNTVSILLNGTGGFFHSQVDSMLLEPFPWDWPWAISTGNG